MMSMKLPSNEEMKKWNVDQVQEFLAQVQRQIYSWLNSQYCQLSI